MYSLSIKIHELESTNQFQKAQNEKLTFKININ
jgi:hypothetical protein